MSMPMPRGLDHLVIGLHDLEAGAAFYERLGFQVGARNRHPWGTENRLVQFPGAFLELITMGEGASPPEPSGRAFSFGAFVRDALARGEGLSMAVLESQDAARDAAGFAADGIGDYEPFFFERQARRPDGSEVRVAFSLAFAQDRQAPDCGVFVCQQHEPQNFWNPDFQRHANGVSGLAAVTMVANNPTDHHIFLEAFTGLRAPRSSSFGLTAVLPRGRFEILTPTAVGALYGVDAGPEARFVAFAVTVPDLHVVASRLRVEQIGHRRIGPRLVVPPEEAHGVAIVFETAYP